GPVGLCPAGGAAKRSLSKTRRAAASEGAIVTPPLAAAFLDQRGGDLAGAAPADVQSALDAHVAAARAAWPDVTVPPGAFVRHLAKRLRAGGTLDDLRAMRAADVYLALACAGGDEGAIAAFEKRYFGEVDVAAARTRAPAALAVEVKQMLRRILFVAEGKRPAAAGEFAGRGDLRGWVRVAAVRELVRLLAAGRREVKVDDEAFFDVLSPAQDPELAYLRDRYRNELAASVRAACATIPAKERALLR